MLKPEDNERAGARRARQRRRENSSVAIGSRPPLVRNCPRRDGAPVRVRLLGEDLVAFRDSNGTVGLVDAYCPHRRAPMFFGRNEECGLRCVYHGWKFDRDGTCVDMPSEPPTRRSRRR